MYSFFFFFFPLLFLLGICKEIGLGSSNLHHAQTDLDRIKCKRYVALLHYVVCCLFDVWRCRRLLRLCLSDL